MCQQHSRFKFLFSSLIAAVVSTFAASVYSLDSDKFQPIDIAADNAILDDKAGKAIYRGNVELTQGSLKISADQLTIEAGTEGKVEKVIAKGDLAKFTQQPNAEEKPIAAQAITVEYYVAKEKIILIEKAKVVQNDNLFEGNIIEYDIKQQKLQAKGKTLTQTDEDGAPSPNGRVKMVLQPQTEETPDTTPTPTETETETEQAESTPVEAARSEEQTNNE